MTLEEYRKQYVWSISEMARKANLDYNTMKRAIDGDGISVQTARKISEMLSKETGRTVQVADIEGLNVNW